VTPEPKALAFDVFGTVVDWRSSVARDAQPRLAALGREDIDPHEFADAWRGHYQPAMALVRNGRRTWVVLDVLHREMLLATLDGFGIDPAAFGEATLADWTDSWQRLDPWPDAVAGLTRLKARRPIVTLSNGQRRHDDRARPPRSPALGRYPRRRVRARLQARPPDLSLHRRALGLEPGELCLVAAHHSDLAAARACGLLTAFVDRPMEYGGRPAPDAHLAQDWDWRAEDLDDLADRLGS
jgi:2-haloacid dehalogenase